MNDFDFSQSPLPPLVQSTAIPLKVAADRGTDGALVTIGWTDVVGNDVTGYNVKRSTTQGTGYIVVAGCNGVGFLATTCVDATAPPGQTYYYVVSSIASTGAESPNSVAAAVQ